MDHIGLEGHLPICFFIGSVGIGGSGASIDIEIPIGFVFQDAEDTTFPTVIDDSLEVIGFILKISNLILNRIFCQFSENA